MILLKQKLFFLKSHYQQLNKPIIEINIMFESEKI